MNDPTAAADDSALAIAIQPRRFQFRLMHLLVAIGLLSLLLAVFVPLVRELRRSGQRMSSANKLHCIMLGLHNYHDVYRQFPPAYHLDAAGKPAHSWRVLISPYLSSDASGAAYNFDEPWDGPSNRPYATTHFADLYDSATDQASPPGNTSFVAIVGPGTAWEGDQSANLASITDGTNGTLMVVEISHSDIHWMEPRDLPIEELEAWLACPETQAAARRGDSRRVGGLRRWQRALPAARGDDQGAAGAALAGGERHAGCAAG